MSSFAELCPPETEDKFMALLERGNFRSVAARACGLNPGTVDNWIKRGDGRDRRQGPPPADMIRFARRVLQAEATAETTVVDNIINAAEKDGNVGLKFLGRRYSGRWGEKIETTVTLRWVDKVVNSLRSGEVTMDALEANFSPIEIEEIQKALEAPIKEGEFRELGVDAGP